MRSATESCLIISLLRPTIPLGFSVTSVSEVKTDAPVGLIACTERSAAPAVLPDVGIVLQTIMLAAFNYGLGTCTEYSVVIYADVLRRLLGIPQSKLIVLGMAIGNPDLNAPVNNFARPRYPLEALVTWRGFD
jgi:nitroreductase